MCFLDTDPRTVWDQFHACRGDRRRGKGKLTFAAPFFATKPGTSTYVDQIW